MVYAYLFIWETKGEFLLPSSFSASTRILTLLLGLTLEQVDRMMEEVGSPRRSPGWNPHSTYAAEMGLDQSGKLPIETVHAQQAGEKAHVVAGTSHLNNTTV